ncbi:MAG: shikimate dehydrogenase [Cyclobacteriaceae bacterium]|nr:shikimate dehydrogenase [Cyclobacteriaceae bacterium]
MITYGLIGKTLKHSFSKTYFTEKFIKENITGCQYNLYELAEIDELPSLIRREKPAGLNVTIPYKESVLPFLHDMDNSARAVGAVNVIKIKEGKLTGYNSDYYGFKNSLLNWISPEINNALILGTGGAAKAVIAVLKDLHIDFKLVSRNKGDYQYAYLKSNPDIVSGSRLIINTTPLGMSPDITTFPDINYAKIGKEHFIYDLVYNPEMTLFLQKASERGAHIKNGLEMLYGQAEKSWEIWNNT